MCRLILFFRIILHRQGRLMIIAFSWDVSRPNNTPSRTSSNLLTLFSSQPEEKIDSTNWIGLIVANGETTTTTDKYFYFIPDNLLIVLLHLCHCCLLPCCRPPLEKGDYFWDAFIVSENQYNRFHTKKHIKKGKNFNSPAVYLPKDEVEEVEEEEEE